MLGVEPTPRDRAGMPIEEWSAALATSNAREHGPPVTGHSDTNRFSPIERSRTLDSPFFGCVLSLNNVLAEVRRALRKPNLAVVVNLIPGVVSTRALSLPGAFGVLLSMAATAQGLIASDQPASEAGPPIGPTMMQAVPYPYGMHALPDVAPAVPSCYRIGRCSAYDLYRFRDRPNWLTRLAPEAPPESGAEAAWIPYRWFLFLPRRKKTFFHSIGRRAKCVMSTALSADRLIAPTDRARLIAEWSDAITAGRSVPPPTHQPYRMHKPDIGRA